MNEAELQVYRKLKEVPAALREKVRSSAKEELQRWNHSRFERENAERIARQERREPVYAILRKAIKDTPSLSGLAEVIKAAHVGHEAKLTLPPPFKVPAPQPFVKLGSVMFLDGPPFDTVVSSIPTGDNSATMFPFAQNDGTMGFLLNPGLLGNGSITAFAAVGQLFVPQSDGSLFLIATPSFRWAANWWSTWWRLAASSLTLEFIVSVFDPNGNFLFNNVSGAQLLFSESDQNLQDSGSNGSPGDAPITTSLNGSMFATAGNLHFCWVQVVGFATADEKASWGDSHMALFFNGTTPWLLGFMP